MTAADDTLNAISKMVRSEKPLLPPTPTVRIVDSVIGIRRTPNEPEAYFNRGDVMTAYLLLMDCAPRVHGDAVRATNTMVADYGINHTEATRCVLAACLLLDHDIEP